MIRREELLLLCTAMLEKLGGTFTMTMADADRIGDVNLNVQYDLKTDVLTARFLTDDEVRLIRTTPDGTA